MEWKNESKGKKELIIFDEEFAIALGEELLVAYIKKCFEKKEPLERGMHNKAMLFSLFCAKGVFRSSRLKRICAQT